MQATGAFACATCGAKLFEVITCDPDPIPGKVNTLLVICPTCQNGYRFQISSTEAVERTPQDEISYD